MSITSGYGIKLQEHEKVKLEQKSNEKVKFLTNGNEIYYLGKYIPNIANRLKLVTYARAIIHIGAPIFITGKNKTGKTTLAKEIGSYGFDEVIYIGTQNKKEVSKKFQYALEVFGSSEHLLILDEAVFDGGLIQLDERFYEEYKGALIVITKDEIESQLPPSYTHGHNYSFHLKNTEEKTEYTIKQYIAPTSYAYHWITNVIPINLALEDAITTLSVLERIKPHIKSADTFKYFKMQPEEVIEFLEMKYNSRDIFTVQMLEREIGQILDKETLKY